MPNIVKHIKPYESSSLGCDEWSLMCPVNVYAIEKVICVDEGKSKSYLTHLNMNCSIRYPDEIRNSFIQVKLWQSDIDPVIDDVDVDADYVGVGSFRSLDKDCGVLIEDQENIVGNYTVAIPVNVDVLREYSRLLLSTEGRESLIIEAHVDVAGLLNKWNGLGALCVTKFSLVVTSIKQESP